MDDRTPLGFNVHRLPYDAKRMRFPFFSSAIPAPHIQVGREGEDTAVRYLRTLGYTILGRNIHVGKKDEIDILAFDRSEKITVFAEVKSRERSGAYAPEMNITWDKRTAMARAAARWITQRNLDVPYRLDVICVSEGRVVDHYKEIESD